MSKVTLESIDAKLEKHDDQFEKIIDVVLDLKDHVDIIENTMATKQDINHLSNSLDKFMKQVDTYYKEMISLKNKVDRLEKWICLLAEKTGVKLDS